MKKKKLPGKSFLLKYGVPMALIPGIIVAAILGFDYEKLIKTDPRKNTEIFATNVLVKEVEDGDTVQLEKGMPIRLVGIDAPEKGKPYFNEARSYLISLLGNKKVTVEYIQIQNDNYGRLRGYLWVVCDYPSQKYCQDGKINVNVALAGSGLAEVRIEKTFVRLRPDYTNDLKKAEAQAREERLGIWSEK